MSLEEFVTAVGVSVGTLLFLEIMEIRKKEKEKQFEDMVHRARHYAYLEGKWPGEIDKVEAKLRKEREGMK